MARPVDEKIVAMKMDNSDFKQKASETTSLFGKLKESLNRANNTNLNKPVQSLNNLNRAANNTDLSGISRAADAITQRFSTLGVVATTALSNITIKAMDAGASMAKSLSTDQIFSGFNEYEMKMRSIGTMLANTEWAGSTLGDVKNTLSELNNYADKTIYSFAQMTENIGRFTAAGVTLEDSATAIKGLGNLAAISGSNVEQLNTVMYQMSQALAAGKLNLMDWNSLVNGGMAGKKTQDALVATAKAMGKNVDLTNGFRDSIQDGWLTSEVFLATLKKFGKDKSMTDAATKVRTFSGMMDALKESIGSGWATSWEIIFGDFEEATKFWTSISNVLNGIFQKQTDARNKMLKAIFDKGGLNNILQGIQNASKPVVQIFQAIGAGFREAFPPVNVKSIQDLIKGFRNFTESMALSEKTVNNIKTIFAGLFATLAIGWKLIKSVGTAFIGIIPGISDLGSGVLSLVANLFKLPVAFNESSKSGDMLGAITDALKSALTGLGFVLSKIGSGFEYLSSAVSQVWSIMSKGNFSSGPFAENGKFVSVLLAIRDGFKSLFDYLDGINFSSIGDFFSSMGDNLKSFKDSIGGLDGIFDKAFGWLKDNQGWLLAGGGLAGLVAIGYKAFDFFKNLTEPLKNIGETLEGANDALNAFTIGIHVKSLLTIAIAVGVLAVSFKLLADLDAKQITTGLYMIVGSLGAMVGALAIMSKYDITGSFGATLAIIGLASAVSIMAGAIERLSKLNYAQLTKGVIGLVAILGTLSGAIVAIGKFGGPQLGVSALQFVAIAVSIQLLISAIDKIADINTDKLKKGLLSLGAIMVELGLFVAMTKNSKLDAGAALGIVAIGVSVKMITSAVETLGNMKVDQLKKGLVTIGLVLGAITALSVLTKDSSVLASGAGILLMATAMNALIVPFTAFGHMKLETLAKGIGAMGLSLAAMGLASKLMTGLAFSAVGLMAMATAMNMLIVPIGALGSMKLETIIKGVAAMALAMAALGGTATLLSATVVPLLAFSAAIAGLGLAVLAAGAGLSMFAKGLLVFAGLSSGAVVAITATMAALITGFVSLLPAITDLVMKIFNSVLGVIANMAPKIATTLAVLILYLLNTIGKYAPKFIEAGADIIVNIINGLSEAIPRIVSAIANFVMTILRTMTETLRNNGTQFTNQMLQLMGEVVIIMVNAGVQMVNALFGWIPGVKKATSSIGKTAESYIRSNFGAGDAGSDKGKEFSSALRGKSGDAKSAGSAVGKAGKDGVNSANLKTIGTTKGSEFANALLDKKGTAKSSGTSLANAGKSGAESVKMTTSGQNFGQGFADGISSMWDTVSKAASNLAKAASDKIASVLDMHSPSRVTTKQGEHTGQGFANGIRNKTKTVKKSASQLAAAAKKSFNTKMDTAEYKFKMNKISYTTYIKQLKNIRDAYSKYPSLVRKANLEIKKVEDKHIKNNYQKMKDNLELKKYYNQLSLKRELDYWQRIRTAFKKGTSQRIEAEKEVYRVKNEINQKIQDIDDEYTSKFLEANEQLKQSTKELEDARDQEIQDRINSITNFVGLFDKVSKKTGAYGEQLLNNLKGQVDTIKEWTANLHSLTDRKVLDTGLIDQLTEMGPQAANEIAALNSMTDEQLTEYSNLWKEKNSLAKTEATSQLQDMINDTSKKITELQKNTAKQLDIYKKEWLAKIKEIRYGTSNQFVGLNTSLKTIGKQTIQGLINGLKSMEDPLKKQSKSIANSISATIRKVLDIHSPSRKLYSDGANAGQGLVNGLADKLNKVKMIAKDLATAANDSVNKFLDSFEVKDDNEIHFKAVIDYDGIDNKKINDNIAIIPDVSYANKAITATKKANDEKYQYNTQQSSTDNSRTFAPVTNINAGPSAKDIARENERSMRKLAYEFGV